MVTALELLIETGEEALYGGWMAKARHIRVRPRTHPKGFGSSSKRRGPTGMARSQWSTSNRVGAAPRRRRVRQRLLDGDPPIYVGMGHYADEINLVMVCLQDGEEEIVAERLLEILDTK